MLSVCYSHYQQNCQLRIIFWIIIFMNHDIFIIVLINKKKRSGYHQYLENIYYEDGHNNYDNYSGCCHLYQSHIHSITYHNLSPNGNIRNLWFDSIKLIRISTNHLNLHHHYSHQHHSYHHNNINIALTEA